MSAETNESSSITEVVYVFYKGFVSEFIGFARTFCSFSHVSSLLRPFRVFQLFPTSRSETIDRISCD